VTNPTVPAALRRSLTEHGFDTTDATLDGERIVVGRASEFRLRWMASRLHTFVLAAAFDAPVPRGTLDRYLTSAVHYAISHKGGLPRGLQTGSATIAVALVADDSADEWASRARQPRFAALSFPVAVNTATGSVAYPRRMTVGAIYRAHLTRVVTTVVAPCFPATPVT
jgi:hypothetical protein